MALCPECGGQVSSIMMAGFRPADGVVCRWCHAELVVSKRTRFLLDLLLVSVGSIGLSWMGALFLDSGDPLFLVYLAGILVGLAVVILLVEGLTELVTRIPRDHRDWSKSEKAMGSESMSWDEN